MASLYKVPLLIVLENNFWAQTTPIEMNLSGDIKQRFLGFNIETHEFNSPDVDFLFNELKPIVEDVRIKRKPVCLIMNTHRLGPHSKGDDTRGIEYINEIKKNDPLLISENKLDNYKDIEKSVRDEISVILEEIGVVL